LGVVLVSVTLPGRDFFLEGRFVGNAAAQALGGQNGAFGLGPCRASFHALSCSAIRTGWRGEVTDVRLLQGDLAQAWSELGRDYATVVMRFSMIDADFWLFVPTATAIPKLETVYIYYEAISRSRPVAALAGQPGNVRSPSKKLPVRGRRSGRQDRPFGKRALNVSPVQPFSMSPLRAEEMVLPPNRTTCRKRTA